MVLIKIDRATIRENPNAGNTVYYVPGKPEISEDGSTRTMNIQTLYSLTPEPKWLYKYTPTVIECKNCKKFIIHTELESDSFDYDGGYSNRVCPECGEWDCCDIEFEKITDVIE